MELVFLKLIEGFNPKLRPVCFKFLMLLISNFYRVIHCLLLKNKKLQLYNLPNKSTLILFWFWIFNHSIHHDISQYDTTIKGHKDSKS